MTVAAEGRFPGRIKILEGLEVLDVDFSDMKFTTGEEIDAFYDDPMMRWIMPDDEKRDAVTDLPDPDRSMWPIRLLAFPLAALVRRSRRCAGMRRQ